jgi:ribosomal protein L32
VGEERVPKKRYSSKWRRRRRTRLRIKIIKERIKERRIIKGKICNE